MRGKRASRGTDFLLRTLQEQVVDDVAGELLIEAARVMDVIEELVAAVRADGMMVDGRVHPAAVELRQQRQQLSRLLRQLDLPEPELEGDAERPSTTRAKKAARSRWGPAQR